MRICVGSVGFAFVSFLFAFNISTAFASDPPWVEVRSPHFSVVTDAGEKRGHETALKFEQMRAVFGAMLVKANVNLPVPLQIVAFRNTKEMRQFAPLWHGKPTQLAGLFQSGPDRNFILLDMSVENAWTVVFHEYAHRLLSGNITGETQPWFDEGFAEYFSTIEVDAKVAKLGRMPPPGAWETLQRYGLMKITDLLEVQHNSQEYNEGDRRSVFYAQSWLLVHYLYDTKQAPMIARYFDAVIDQKANIENGIQRAFGTSTAQLDKELHEYFARGRVTYTTIPTPPGIETTGYTVTAMSAVAAKAVLADAHLHSMDYQDKAVSEFQEVLATEPGNEAALRGLGYAALQKKDFDRASEYFKKAVQADSKDARVYYYSALLMHRQGGMARTPEEAATIKKQLEASIALDPNFADSYALLALAQMTVGDQDKAADSMKKALQLDPHNEQYLFNLSQIYLTNRKVNEATGVLQGLGNSRNPEVAARARESMEQVARMKTVLDAMAKQSESGPEVVSAEHLAPAKSNGTGQNSTPRPVPIDTHAPKFLKGKLVGVDCSAPPVAVMTVVSDQKSWKLKVFDRKNVIVIGADKFSCAWTNQNVAVNYRQTAENEGSVVTVEIQ